MKHLIASVIVLLFASTASAGSVWNVVKDGGGLGEVSATASPGKTYQSTVDGTGETVPLNVKNCASWRVIILVGVNNEIVHCENLTCSNPIDLQIDQSAGATYSSWSAQYLMVDDASTSDLVEIVCGK